ncbi:pathogenicity island protein [Sporosarcina sp. P3]|uniref:pathogenicity island protein n=1 Tax=Sporosarcina sp. P3 TaxID=2048245 RepID=UPI000C16B7AD|nr:pathogenicity island protein [Sporosarcina sp. P3]PID20162.1 pathogenicity island protein [Sporosarcina sp. P3]
MTEKIIQIIPAPENLYVVHEDEEGKFTTKVVCLALTGEGDVFMMDSDDYGTISEITPNHEGIRWHQLEGTE